MVIQTAMTESRQEATTTAPGSASCRRVINDMKDGSDNASVQRHCETGRLRISGARGGGVNARRRVMDTLGVGAKYHSVVVDKFVGAE